MIDTDHCPRCSRQLTREGIVSFGGHELPVFQCEDGVVRKPVFGPGTEEFDLPSTFCVDPAGRHADEPSEVDADDHGEGWNPSLDE